MNKEEAWFVILSVAGIIAIFFLVRNILIQDWFFVNTSIILVFWIIFMAGIWFEKACNKKKENEKK